MTERGISIGILLRSKYKISVLVINIPYHIHNQHYRMIYQHKIYLLIQCDPLIRDVVYKPLLRKVPIPIISYHVNLFGFKGQDNVIKITNNVILLVLD